MAPGVCLAEGDNRRSFTPLVRLRVQQRVSLKSRSQEDEKKGKEEEEEKKEKKMKEKGRRI